MRILVIDDDFVSRAKLEALLGRYGSVDTAPDGPSAISLFDEAHAAGEPYALISVDVEMPGMSGQEVVRWIRDWEQVAHPPVREAKVLMVSIHDDHNVWTSFREGCDGYLVKPIQPHDVDSSMRELGLELSQ